MVKMILTDIDGTILQEATNEINPAYFEVISELITRGVVFVAASGRAVESIKRVFAPLREEIRVIALNGNIINYRDESRVVHPIPTEWVRELWQELSEIPDAESITETSTEVFTPWTGSEMVRIIEEDFKFKVNATGGWDKLPEGDLCMASIYHPDGSEAFLKNHNLQERWEGRLHIMPSSSVWIDCIMPGVSKGNAMLKLCKELGIEPKDTIAFGDNHNDISMLQVAGIGYAVEDGRPEAIAAADRIVPGYKEDGVLQELKKLLAQIQ